MSLITKYFDKSVENYFYHFTFLFETMLHTVKQCIRMLLSQNKKYNLDYEDFILITVSNRNEDECWKK